MHEEDPRVVVYRQLEDRLQKGVRRLQRPHFSGADGMAWQRDIQ